MSDSRSDAELITGVRGGDEEAYAELYRRHSPAALRFARSLGPQAADAEDLVAEAFARVLTALRGGNGPDEAFRPYPPAVRPPPARSAPPSPSRPA